MHGQKNIKITLVDNYNTNTLTSVVLLSRM